MLGLITLFAFQFEPLGVPLLLLGVVGGLLGPAIYAAVALRAAANMHGVSQPRLEWACLWFVLGVAQVLVACAGLVIS